MAYASTSWQKGQSGNPKGRPKGTKLSLKREELINSLLDGVQERWEKILTHQLDSAASGDFNATRLLFEYALPKPKPCGSERDSEDEMDLEGLDTEEKRNEARRITEEAQEKVLKLCNAESEL